ncbi:ectoine/hydroxyectoine ABC transporter permease subunit EhuD [Leucobacter aridicollis]|uniref:ectoine/hydroxyectoine ABC transporter permease subunit EhuD n=1 Tax=Leucobacter aridicollis TaxID=283878 RepID=UPI002106F632|nr:ectoine/hydroxyectoine ABC transporter permease subunit EhuD [Leucobacter aridicollis]UTX53797.1 ectoine/hydroxyectoine ABC transporter permease subunit EhuD [Leucobacter aridicollis]
MTDGIWNWQYAFEALPVLLTAFVQVTLLVTILGSAIAAALGLVIAITRQSAPKPLARLVGAVANFIRMTPIVVQLLFVYYAVPAVSPVTIGVIVFGVHYATYMAESYRAGIESVPPGQWEASTALSMSRGRTWWAVVIPQALRNTLPSLGNYVIAMFKDTPFLMAITVTELVRAAQLFGGQHFRYIEAITIAGVIFLLASYPTSLLISRMEKRLVART